MESIWVGLLSSVTANAICVTVMPINRTGCEFNKNAVHAHIMSWNGMFWVRQNSAGSSFSGGKPTHIFCFDHLNYKEEVIFTGYEIIYLFNIKYTKYIKYIKII